MSSGGLSAVGRRIAPPRARRSVPDAPRSAFVRVHMTTLLTIFLLLQFLIPPRLVIRGMGAVGRPAVLMGAVLLLIWVLGLMRPPGLPSGLQPARWVVGLYLGLQLVGYAVGYDRLLPEAEASSADRWLIMSLAMTGLALATMDGLRSRRELDRLLTTLVFLGAVMAMVGVLQFYGVVDLTRYIRIPGLVQHAGMVGISSRGDAGLSRVAGTAGHYIEFGVVLSLIFPIALHYAFFARHWFRRVLAWGAAALIGGAIPLSISRSGILTLATVFVLLMVVWPWRRRYNAAVIVIVALGAYRLVVPGILGTLRALFTNVDNDPSVQNRLEDVEYVVRMWSMRPWWGRGAGTFIPENYIVIDNQIYQTLITGGIIGLVGLVLLFTGPYLMARSVRLRGVDQETRHLAQCLAVVMPASFLASGTFDSFAFSTFFAVVFFCIGAIGALWRFESEWPPRPLQESNPLDAVVTSPIAANWIARIQRANSDVDVRRAAWRQPGRR